MNTNNTPELVALLELSERATPGIWEMYGGTNHGRVQTADVIVCDGSPPHFMGKEDAKFIAALVNWFRSTRAATVPQGVSVDAARLNYVLGKVFFDRHGPCLPCGRTKIDQDMIAESIKHIDAAMTPPPAATGVGEPAWDIVAHDGKAYSPAEQDAMKETNTATSGLDALEAFNKVAAFVHVGKFGALGWEDRLDVAAANFVHDHADTIRKALAAQPAPGVGGPDFHTRFQRAANVMCATYRREVGKEMLLSVAELLAYDVLKADAAISTRPAESVAQGGGGGDDRLLAALERAGKAESALRRLVDECENDTVPGWEDRMAACILAANTTLSPATSPTPATGSDGEVTDAMVRAAVKATRDPTETGLEHDEYARAVLEAALASNADGGES